MLEHATVLCGQSTDRSEPEVAGAFMEAILRPQI